MTALSINSLMLQCSVADRPEMHVVFSEIFISLIDASTQDVFGEE